MTTVAVLGGGQLGRMLGLAGIPLGVDFRFLDPSDDAPASAVGHLVVGALGDERALAETARGADVVTYEWEGVPSEAARLLAARHEVRPGARSLEVSQDRLHEKESFRALGIATADFDTVDSREELEAASERIGLPAVLKTRRGGYDGKGQAVLRDPADVETAWEQLGGVPLLLEGFVAFDRELSIVAVRDEHGTVGCWPLVENHHADGILQRTIAPAPGADARLHARADAIARSLLEELDHVGVLAVELFEVGGELLANEFAPRVHNSGHWTIEGAATSQFENHVRAVLGWPLGDTQEMGPAVMINCIGQMPDRAAVFTIEGAHLHDYGKAPRPGRKLGHVTVTGGDADDVAARVRTLEALLA
ncbi:MAG TPA: 5-(carboxyamino)imidazole ribonucleotide synthase [Acidimicrobiia bacterium]|jgi:5-(carboxyamino)imidazole ribonucleotide synthase